MAEAVQRGARKAAGKAQDAAQEAREPQDGAPQTSGHVVIDASDHIAGRLASGVAKMLLEGRRVSLVNCERIMISGTRSNIVGEYRKFLGIASILHPKHGPFHPRRPDTIITRMVRGMLPRKKPSGVAAHRRLRAYVGTPRELRSHGKERIAGAMITRAHSSYTSMADLGETVGWGR